jgi:Rod binding domain-containing protein
VTLSLPTPAPTDAEPGVRRRPAGSLLEHQRSFASALGRDNHVVGAGAEPARDKARTAAEQLVALAFVQPMLKQMRETSHAAPPFAPTPAERQFGALMDADLAQGIVRAWRFPLVDALAHDLLTRMDRVRAAIDEARNVNADPTVTPGVAPLAAHP